MSATTSVAKGQRWTGRVLSGIGVAFLVFDAVIKILTIDPVVESFRQLGLPVSLSVPIGILELVCAGVYLIPRTAPLGAVLLTGYLGGAIATHIRALSPLFSHALFPVYIAALIWSGLYLRDARVRTLNPLITRVGS
jgi:hypothetical protein